VQPTALSRWQSPKARVISGALVEKAKISHSVMDRTRVQGSRQSGSLPKKRETCGSVGANPVATSRFAMDHIIGDRGNYPARFQMCTTEYPEIPHWLILSF